MKTERNYRRTFARRAARWAVRFLCIGGLALAAAVTFGGLAGCAGAPGIAIEVCIVDPEYGKICGTYANGVVTLKADVELPPELASSIKDRIKKLADR